MSEPTGNHQKLQRLSIVYILSGIGIIISGLLVVAFNIAVPFSAPDGIVYTVLFFPFACFFGWLSLKQYGALFCRKPQVARNTPPLREGYCNFL